jgi:hypothetical protein
MGKNILNGFIPSNPITITFTRLRLFVIFLLIGFIGFLFYLRSENKEELEILSAKQNEMRLMITKYIEDMSGTKIGDEESKDYRSKIDDYRKKLKMVDEEINQIHGLWYMKEFNSK